MLAAKKQHVADRFAANFDLGDQLGVCGFLTSDFIRFVGLLSPPDTVQLVHSGNKVVRAVTLADILAP
ncbi:hypothetical protein D3C81_2030160 [compost metagenome]